MYENPGERAWLPAADAHVWQVRLLCLVSLKLEMQDTGTWLSG